MPETLGIAALAVSLLVASRAADAAIYYWDTTTTGLWSNGANWSDNGVIAGLTGTVPLSTDSVVFNQSTVNGNEIVQLDAATGIVGMTFLNTGTTTIQSSSTTTQTLTLGSGGIFVGSGAGAVTIGNATNGTTLTASAPQVWTNASANALTLVQQVNLASNSLTVNGTTTLTGGVTAGGSLTVGGGTLTLNAASAFSGTTTINGGSLTIGTGGSLTGSTTLSLANGALNYNPTSGTLSFATGGTTVGSGLSSVTAAAGGTVNLGAITRSAGGVLNVGSTGSVITSSANTNGILGPWAFFGSGANTRYAVGNGASAMTGLAVTAAAASTVTSTAGTANVNVNATGTLGASASVHTLQYSGAAGTLTTTTAFTTRGILNTGTGTLTVAGSVTAASDMLVVNAANSGVTFNNSLTTLSGMQQLVFTGASGFNIGTASLGSAFISGIAGTPVIKNGANTFTITTTGAVAAISGAVPITVNGGTLSIAGSNNLTTNRIGTGAITLNAAGAPTVTVGTTGAADTFPNALNVSGAVGTAIVQTSSGGHTWSGAIAFQSGTTGGTTLRFVNQNSSASTMTVSGAVSGVGNLEFNGTGSGSPFTLSNASINNTGTITLSSTNAAGNLNVSGTIGSNVTGVSVVSAGTATMTLSGTNTFNAPVTVTSGTLSFNTINSIGAGSGSALGQPTTAASGSILLGGSGRLSYTGATASSDRPIVLTASGATIQNASATAGATLTLSGGITGTNTALTLRGAQNITASGVISLGTGGISKTDVGTVTLTGANLFSGNVVIAQGPLSVNSIADSGPSALGTGTTLTLGQNTANPSGTLIVTGSAANSTSRALTLLGGSAAATQTIQNDSSGGLTLGGAFTYTASTAATTLQLQGSGTGVLNSLINSATTGTPALSLTKSGAGTWTLSQNNVYQGATAVTQGTLVVNGAPAGTTGYTVSGTAGNNATLAGSGTLAAPVTMSAGTAFTGAAVNPGTVGGAGTLTVNAALTTNAFSRLNFDFNTATTAGGGVNDLLSTTTLPVLGGLTQVNVNALSPLTTGGVYTLISGYTGTIANASNLQLGEVTGDPARSLLGVLNNDGSLQVVAGGATPTNAFWANNQGTGVWNSANLGAVTTNWNTDATSGTDTTALPGATTTVRFSTTAPAPSTTTTTLGQDFSIAGLVFEASQGSTAIGIGGANTLTVGTGGITVSGGVPTITAGLALGGAQSWTNNTANPLTVGTVTNGANTVTLLGSGNFNQTGVWGNGSGGITAGPAFTGTLTLSQANTFTGAVTVNSGTVVATGNAAALGAGSLNLAGGTLRLTNASTANLGYGRNTTVSGNVAITSDVTASGAGNTYTLGTLAIGGQTLTVGGGSNVASGTAGVTFGAVTLSGAPTFTVNNPAGGGSTLLTLGAISNGANLLTFNGTGNATVSGVLGNGAGGLTMGGTGTLTLSAANTYTGVTTVNAGTLAVSGTGTLGSASALTLSGGSLNLGTTSQTVGAVSITAPAASGDTIANGTLTGTSYAASNTTGTAVISAILAGTGTFTKTGGGTATLSGVNTYNGTTTLSAGTLRATTSASALGAGALSLGGGTLQLSNASGTPLSFGRNTTVTANAAITSDVTASGAGNTYTLGTLAIGAQTLTVGGGSNVTSGTAGVTFGAVTLSGAPTFTVNNPSGGGTTLLTLGAVTNGANLVTFNGTGNATVTGVIGNGTGGLTMAGSGTLTLSSAANTYTGATTITSGTLSVGNVVVATGASGLGNATSAVVLGGASTRGTLLYTGAAATYTRNFTVNAGGGEVTSTANLLTLLPGTTPTFAPIALTSGSLTLGTGAVAGTQYITVGSTAMTGPLFTGTNALNINGTGGVGRVTLTNLSGNVVTAAAMPINIRAGQLYYSRGGTATAVANLLGTGLITLTPATTNGGNLFLDVNTVTNTLGNAFAIADAPGTATIGISGGITISQAVTGPNGSNTPTLLLQNTNGTAYTLTLSGGVTGKLNLQLQGTHASANNPITLSTTAVNNAGTISNITTTGSSTMTVSAPVGANVTGLIQAGITPFTISGAITANAAGLPFTSTNTGAMTVSGAITAGAAAPITASATSTGTITFSGASTGMTGGFRVLAGTVLATTSANALGANTNAVTLGDTSGAASATLNVGTTALTYPQPITVAAGSSGTKTIIGGAATATLSGGITLNDNLTVSLAGGSNLNVSGVIQGSRDLTLNSSGAGVYVPQGANTYSGMTRLVAGLTVANSDSVGSASTANLVSGPYGTGTLSFEGGSTRPTTGPNGNVIGNAVSIGANVTFTANNTNTLTFTGPVTLAGTGVTRTLAYPQAGGTIAFSGAIGDGGNVNAVTIGSTHTGTFVFGGANTYTGLTTVQAGVLRVTGSLANNTPVAVVPGVAAGAQLTFVNGAANTPANFSALTLGNSTGPAIIGLDLGTASDTLTTSAAATATGAVQFGINPAAGFGPGTYTLVSAASGLTSNASPAVYGLAGGVGGYSYTFTNTDSQVQLNVTAGTAGARYWRGTVAGANWGSVNANGEGNWTSDAAGTTVASLPGAFNTVFFSADNATGPGLTSTLANDFTVNDLEFLSAPAGVSSVVLNPGIAPTGNAGTLTISPANPADGIGLAQGAGAVTISAPITLGAPQTWSVDSSTPASGTASSLTVSGAISGIAANGITFTAPAGTTPIILSSANTYAGPSTVAANAIVQAGIAGALSPNTPWTVNGTLSTGAFSHTTGSLGGSGVVQNGSATNVTLTIGSDNLASATFAGTIQNGSTGTLSLTKAGTGTQILAGANTYTGATTVSAGTLRAGSTSALGTVGALTVTSPGSLDLGGFNNTVGSLAASTGTITDSSPAGSGGILQITGTTTTAIAATVTGSVGFQYQNNNGSNALFSNASNTYSGGTYLGIGTNRARYTPAASATVGNGVGAALTAGIFGTGPIHLGRTPADQGQIYLSNGTVTINNPITYNSVLGSDVVGGVRLQTSTNGVFNGVQTAGLSAISLGAHGGAGAVTINGKLTGSGVFTGTIQNLNGNLGAGYVIGTNAGLIIGASNNNIATVILKNTASNNDYTGDTWVTASGILRTDLANQLPSGAGTGNLYLTGTFNMQGLNQATGGLSEAGIVDGVSGTPTLTIGGNNATGLTFGGIIRNTAGTLTLTKIGGGTQTLSGASTFGGPLNVNGGLIAFATSPATSGPLGNSTVVNLNGGGISYTASGTNALNRAIAIGAGNGTLDVVSSVGTLTVAGASVSSVGGSLVKTGPGNALITGTTTLGGGAGVVVNGGTLQAGFGTGGISSITVGGSGSLLFQNSATQALTLGSTGTVLTLSNGARLGFELNGATSDSITVPTGGGLSLTGGFTFDFINTGAGISATTYTLLTAPVGSALNTFTYTLGSAPLGYNYSFVTSDTQVLLQTAAYTPIYWRGGTDSSWATAANFASDSSGTTPAGRPPLANETVIFNATNAAGPTITTTLDGSLTVDSLQFNGFGTPATTQVTIAQGTGGTLTVAPASASGGIAILTGGGSATISAPLTLDATLSANQAWNVVDAASTLTFSGDVAFGANVNKAGAGTVVLSGANSGSGNFSLTAGRLRLNSPAALGTGSLSIAAGTSLDNTSGSAVAMTGNGPINVNGDFTFTGSSSLGLGSGAVALSGNPTVTVAANTLTLGGAISGATGLTKAGAGALALNGTRSFTGALSIGAGALTLGGNSTANGTVTLSGGTLNLGHAGALGTGGFVIAAGTTIDNTSGGPLTNANANATTLNGGFTFTGTDNLNLGTGAISMTATPTITVAAKTLTLAGNITGNAFGLTKGGAGTLTLAGTNVYTGNTTVNGGTLNITGSITGNTTTSRLDYGTTAGATVVNHSGSLTAWVIRGADVAGAVSVFNQTAGTVTIVPTNGADNQYLANSGGYGMLNITGGTFTTGRFNGTALTTGNGATAIIYVGGTGSFTQNVGDWFLPIRNSGMMSMTVAPGGSFTRAAAVTNPFSITGLQMSSTNNVSYGILNVAGGTVDTGVRGLSFGSGTFASGTFTSTGFVNVSGGTLLLGLNTATGTNAVGTTNGFFNFVGGTLRATNAMTAVIPPSTANYTFRSTIFGPVTNNDSGNAAFNSQIGTTSNFGGGLIVDTNTFSVTFSNPLVGADGTFGVTQPDITIPTTGNSGYVGAPMVQFAAPAAAGGVPASGYALISGGQVTGIVITNPGTYAAGETPLITLTGGGGSIAAFNTAALATANTAAGVTKSGAGTLILSGANTYTGPTVIAAGTLQLGAAGTSGSLSPSSAISTSGTLAFNRTDTLTQGTNFAATIGGSGGLSQVGTGTVVLNGVNTYTGPTTLTAGTLSVAAASNLGDAASNLVFDGGTLQITGTTLASLSGIGHAVSFNAGKTVGFDINNAAHTFTADQALTQGTGGLNKLGAGTLVLSQTNAFTGATSITAGTLVIAGATNVGAGTVTISSGSALTVTTGGSLTTTGELRPGAVSNGNQFTVQSGAAVNAGSITSPWGTSYAIDGTLTTSGTWTVSTNRTTDTFNGAGTISASALTIGNASTGVNYTGTGVINITNAVTIASNSGTGNAAYTQTSGTLNAGSILLGDSTTNTTGTRTFNLNGGRVNIGSGGMATTGTTTATRVVNLGAGTLGARADWSSSLAVSLTSATPGVTIDTLDSVDGTTGRTVTLSGILSGTGSLTKASVGTLLLSAANTFSGTTTVGGGVLALNNNLAIQNSILSTTGDGTIAFGSGVTTPTLGGLSGVSGDLATEVSSGYGSVTSLTLNPGTGSTVTYGGVIADGAAGMALIKTGAGTQVLAGASTYTGVTTISAGTLTVGGPETPGTSGPLGNQAASAAGTILMTGGTLQFSAANTTDYSGRLGAGGAQTWNIDTNAQAVTFASVLQGAGSTLNKFGAGTLTLSAANTFTGATTIGGGTLTVGGSGTLSSASALTLSGGSLDLGTTSQTVGAVSITAAAAGGDAIANGSLTGTSYAASNAAGNAIISANLLGTAAFTKTGAGTTTLAGINTYTGTTTINQGTLKLIGSAVLGGATGSTTDANNIVFGQNLDSGVLEFDTVANLGPADQIRFRNTGGTAGLGGELLYVGTTNQTLSKTIQCDTSIGIRIESNSVGGSLTVNGPFSQTNRALYLGGSGTGDNTLASVFSGTGGVTKRDPGRWVFSVAQTYSGSTTIDQGTLAFAVDQTMTGGLVYGVANAATNTGRLDLGLANATFPSLLVRTNSVTANTIAVGAGKTLTVNGNVTLGYDAAAGTGATRSNLTVSGAGAMSIVGTTITIGTNQAAVNAAYWNEATLDVTGLASFSTNVTTFNVGVGTSTQGPGTLLLSDTANIIVATTLTAGDTGPNNGRGTGRIQLGAGTNLIQVDTFNIGRGKNTGPGLVEFLSKTAGSPGTVTIVNKAGTGAANITVGDNNGTATGGGAVGTLDLRGHVATVTAGTLLAGRNNMASSTGSVTSDISFDAGTFTVNTLTMAQKTGAGTGGVTATLNVGGGSFTVNAGGAFTLGSQATAGTASATFNLTGGTFTSNADILDGGGATTSTINLSGGTLDMAGRSIGNATNVIDVLTLASGGLRNVAQINNGSAITKTTAGTLALTGTSSYTGQTLVQAGTLSFDSIANVGGGSSALGAPANAGNGTIALGSAATGATLQYLGGTLASTDRIVSLAGTTGGATLDSSGTGAITFASNLTASGAGSKTLTLSGTNTGANTLAGIIPDNSVANPTALTKTGVGRWVLSGANTYTGGTTVSGGTLALAGAGTLGGGAVLVAGGTLDLGGLSTSNVINFQSGGLANANLATTTNVLVGATLTTNGLTLGGSVNVTGSLEGSGTVGLISGVGVIAPGNSPGILTASQLDFSGGISQKFEFTNANVDPTWSNALASVNDVLRLTNANPFNGTSATSANVFDIYFDVASLSGAERFYGGVFTDSTSDPFDSLRNATYNYYVRGDGSGPVSYKGTGYYTLAQYNAANSTSLSVIVGTQQVPSATFATGEVVNGYVQVLAVPEPGVLTLLLAGAAALAGFRFSRGCRARPASGTSDVRPDRR